MRVERWAGRTLIRLPVLEPELSFSVDGWSGRLKAGIAAGIGLVFLAFPFLLILRLASSPFRRWPQDSIETALAVCLLISIAIFWVMGWGIAALFLAGFFATSSDVQVDASSVVMRRSSRLSRRRRRWTRPVMAIQIRPPAQAGVRWVDQPLDHKSARIVLLAEGGDEFVLTERRLYPQAVEIATELARELSVATGRPAPTVVDMVDESCRQGDSSSPRGVNEFVVLEMPEGTVIRPARPYPGLSAMLRLGTFRAGIWAVLLPHPLCMGVIELWPELFGVLRPVIWRITLMYAVTGAMWMALVWYLENQRRSYLINVLHLEQVIDVRLWRRRRRWNRGDVIAVRIGRRIGDNNRHSDALELVLRTGASEVIETGRLPYLQRLALLLRQSLEVGSQHDAVAVAGPPMTNDRGH